MKTRTFQLDVWTAAFVLAFWTSFGSARTTDVGASMRKLIEAGWVEQDRQFTGAMQPAKSADFALEHTKQLIRRGYRLAERLRRLSASDTRLEPLVTRLRQAEARMQALEPASDVPVDDRRSIYLDVRWTTRRIAFCNPLLDFDKILFIKRHDPGGVYHMCDQYYGFNAIPGGGLFVLSNPFGSDPALTNLLADAVVEKGRLKGRLLKPGAFLSPEMSYDGRKILFAYTEGKGENLQWTPESCYHIFRVNSDGTGLVQLTDGPWNDFDPCFLPNGRIVFISERRGGYLRCGRHCPTYTLHSMASEGSVKGLRARGGFEVDMEWKDGQLTEATIRANRDGAFRIYAQDKLSKVISLKKGESKVWPGTK